MTHIVFMFHDASTSKFVAKQFYEIDGWFHMVLENDARQRINSRYVVSVATRLVVEEKTSG